jgi:purine-binding chemotaxis protein CheW
MSAPSQADERELAIAARLRLEFDRGFAAAASVGEGERTAYLAIRVGGDPFALRMSDLLGVHVDRTVVPLPSATPSLLGIASFRGTLTPVHDLRLLLGYPAHAPARWLARLAGRISTALAFEALDGQLAIAADGAGGGAGGAGAEVVAPRAAALTRGVVPTREGLRPVIDVAAVLATLARHQGPSRPPAEK